MGGGGGRIRPRTLKKRPSEDLPPSTANFIINNSTPQYAGPASLGGWGFSWHYPPLPRPAKLSKTLPISLSQPPLPSPPLCQSSRSAPRLSQPHRSHVSVRLSHQRPPPPLKASHALPRHALCFDHATKTCNQIKVKLGTYAVSLVIHWDAD